MKSFFSLLPFLLLSLSSLSQELYFPPLSGDEWQSTSPEELNWCTDELDELVNFLGQEQTKAFIVLKDGKIVLEEYFDSYTPDSLWAWFSAGKTITAVLTGIAQEEGLLNINDKISDYLGEGWTSLEPEKEDLITIRHQLTMSSGLDEAGGYCTLDSCLTYKADAGDRWFYHNAPYSLLRPVLENATGRNLNIYTAQKLRSTIGMRGFWIPSGFNNFYLSTARDMARFGLMIQNQGTWDQTPVLGDFNYYQAMINSSQSLNPSYGYLWWLNGQGTYIPPGIPFAINTDLAPDAPQDVYTAAGALGQFVSISPSNGLVMIRQGLSSNSDLVPISLHNEIWKRLMAVACTPTATQELQPDQIKVYPNPTGDLIHVDLNAQMAFEIQVFDLLGQRVVQVENQSVVDLSSLPSGVYQLLLRQGGSVFGQKVIRY